MTSRDLRALTQRDFLATTACGLGLLALASIFEEQGLLASAATDAGGNIVQQLLA